jgi:FHS family glucose/mannose:H+ symporter-like MFS transporter
VSPADGAPGDGPAATTGRVAPLLIYGGGLAQGLALVSFPAASSILTSPSGYALSTGQYGLMFAPQVVLAITAAALSPVWAKHWSLQRVLQAGLLANVLAMLLLVASQFVDTSPAAYPMLLLATAALGFGFGSSVSALNTFAANLYAGRQDRSVLTLNVLLGAGTALAPLLIALFLALGAWWMLPVVVSVGVLVLLVATTRVTLNPGPAASRSASGGVSRTLLPARFWWYAAAVVLYGVCETLFGNWSSLYLTGERGLTPQSASYALAAFWAFVTIGRIIVAVLPPRIPPTLVFLLLPILIALASLAVAAASSTITAVAAYAAAGLACSAMLPLSLSFAGREFPRLGATSSGELIAGYQVGYGITAFGVAPLIAATGIATGGIYLVGAGVAVALVLLARMVTASPAVRTAPAGPLHPRSDTAAQGKK